MSPDRTMAQAMSPGERRAAVSLSGIYALRMLGLFMVLPVFSLYAKDLPGATPMLIGFAIGVYGLTQAMLQIPFGLLSDRLGRKPVITGGLLLFAVGSVVAALSSTIYGVIIGRALQGSGAIAAAVMALAADLSREEQRTKVMAMIGMSIGGAFALALVAGPVLNHWVGVPGIFWITALLALGSIGALKLWVPQPVQSRFHRDAESAPSQIKSVLADGQLLRLDLGIFLLHAMLTATFVVLPLALRDEAGLDPSQHWKLYLPVLVLSVAAMVPFIIIAEKYRRMKQVFIGAILVLGVSQLGLMEFHHSVVVIFIMAVALFAAFNLLEATLPSLISKMAPPDRKGTAMGVYSSFQFLGAFVGGSTGGWIYGQFGFGGVFGYCAVLAGVWAMIAQSMRNPRYLTSHMVNVGKVSEEQARAIALRLTQVAGVAEAVVIVEDGVAYLKVDKHTLDVDALQEFSAAQG